MNFWYRCMEKLRRFMYGRYGNDRLNWVLFAVALVVNVFSYVRYLWFLSFVSLAIFGWMLFRGLSRNIPARQRENDALMRFWGKVKTFFNLRRKMWRERKTHKYFRCRHCGAMLRVPKGRGKVSVGCPRCKGRTDKKT